MEARRQELLHDGRKVSRGGGCDVSGSIESSLSGPRGIEPAKNRSWGSEPEVRRNCRLHAVIVVGSLGRLFLQDGECL